MRVIIADDDVIVLAGVRVLLESFDDLTVSASCSSLDELISAIDRDPPDVVLTDIRMPPGNSTEGVEAARMLRASHPDIGVVVLSQFVNPMLAFAVLEDGASGRGYLLKEHVSNGEYLVEALRSVAGGGSFIDNLVLDALVAARSSGPGTELARLTAREREVLSLVAEGHSNATISERLFVGERAVEKHISSIFSKLELTPESRRHRRVAAVLSYLADEAQQVGDWRPLP